jgi:hypothetical protein
MAGREDAEGMILVFAIPQGRAHISQKKVPGDLLDDHPDSRCMRKSIQALRE